MAGSISRSSDGLRSAFEGDDGLLCGCEMGDSRREWDGDGDGDVAEFGLL